MYRFLRKISIRREKTSNRIHIAKPHASFMAMVVKTVTFILVLVLVPSCLGEQYEVTATANSTSEQVLLVNTEHLLPEDYVPDDLILLSLEDRYFALESDDIELSYTAFKPLYEMLKDAADDGVDGYIMTSGYRDAERQQEIYDEDNAGVATVPGASEHQTGLAFDITAEHGGNGFASTEQFEWLYENCWDYGFILRYPYGKQSITGIPYEPWHYRYVGVEIAQEIRENDWTLEEYCENKGLV